jgi:hypothetical protein
MRLTLYDDINEPEKTAQEIAAFRAKLAKQLGTGTADLYKRRYNEHLAPALKPWNKETYHATKAVGDQFPLKYEEIASKLLPPQSESIEEEHRKIQDFKNGLGLGDTPCILLWQRLSGQRGGAHKELDSHPSVLMQMAQAISQRFKDRTIILIGDDAGITEEALRDAGVSNEILILNEYWNRPDAKDSKAFPTREHQNYFLSLLSTQNNAVSVGMRSGSLESSALLGIRTIYLDDLGNRAEGRMEFWAGNAAHTRGELFSNPEAEMDNVAHINKHESEHQGPVSNYKRLATRNQLGSQAGDRLAYFDTLLGQVAKAKIAGENLLPDNDGEVDEMIAALKQFDDDLEKLEPAELVEQGPGRFKRLQKDLNRLAQPFAGKKKTFDGKEIADLEMAIQGAKQNSLLSPSELDQLTYLIGYLSRPLD